MLKIPTTVALLLVAATVPARGQAPTGAVAGVVTDSSGGRMTGARIGIVSRETGLTRSITTSTSGTYGSPALPPGAYTISAEATAFKRVERVAVVEAGTTTTVDLTLEPGELRDTVTVEAALPLIRYDHHQIGGVVNREQIENLPLNGRNFLELARLEPGVTNPVRGTTNRTFVASLGAGLQTIPRIGFTRTTVDGGSINAVGTIGTGLQVSPEVVQEFQLSTVNFDLATSLTTNAAVNIVTRSGANELRGTGFSFYRDNNLSAYPGLRRDPRSPNPFFQRNQFGATVGGRLLTNRAFFFTSYERHDQRGVVSVQPNIPEFAALGGVFPSPYHGNLFSTRIDARLHSNHHGFARFTYDGNRSFTGANLPSAWPHVTARAGQILAAVTSVLSPNLVNDVRVSQFLLSTSQRPAGQEDCGGCFGLGAPRIIVQDAGLIFGESDAQSFVGHRYQLTESLTWQTGRHNLRAGFEWERATTILSAIWPVQLTLWSPAQVRQRSPGISLPVSFRTVNDILQLPLRSFEISAGPGTVPEREFRPHRVFDLYRLHVADTWRVDSRLTVNFGLGWSYEPNALNHDLTKPAILIPILGAGALNAPRVRYANFAPMIGFAWTATRDAKTVVRGGAGRYFDPVASANSLNLANERLLLSPLGTGRLTASGANIFWDGRRLEFPQPNSFSGQQLLSILAALRARLLGQLNSDNQDFSTRNIDFTKEGANLSDPNYKTPYAVHVNLGVQRELARGVAVSADVVLRQFVNTHINGIDYNRYRSAAGPVSRPCEPEERDDVQAVCSNGPIMFDTTIGRARYKGLLVRADTRVNNRTRFLLSYALGSYAGTNGTGTGTNEQAGGRVFGFNNDDWFENYGPLPTDRRHVLNLSGSVDLPWRLQVAFNVAAYSSPPFSAYVAGMDFNGDGTENDLLPGTKVNQFSRGLDKEDLDRLVNLYNEQWAGRTTPAEQIAPRLTLPSEYAFDDSFFSQDLRITRTFPIGSKSVRLLVFGEVFNLLNIANLVGYSGNLASRTFGQPTGRFTQVFGNGGPRAFQFGARVNF